MGLGFGLREVAGGEEFLGGDELGALGGGVADHVGCVGEVLLACCVTEAGVLDEAELDGSFSGHAEGLLGL